MGIAPAPHFRTVISNTRLKLGSFSRPDGAACALPTIVEVCLMLREVVHHWRLKGGPLRNVVELVAELRGVLARRRHRRLVRGAALVRRAGHLVLRGVREPGQVVEVL